MINRFREEVYQSFEQRGDAGLELIDALTSTPGVESPVALSESPLFRRRFSSVYDVLKWGRFQYERLRQLLDEVQPEDAETIAGYEVYAMDCTDDPAPEAETLPDRSRSKKGKNAPTQVGHRYSWLVRLVNWRTSWCMPQDIERVATTSSDGQVGAKQVEALAERNQRPKVVVADSLYCTLVFMSAFLMTPFTYALVRMRSNQVLYEEAPERQPKQRGRPTNDLAGCTSISVVNVRNHRVSPDSVYSTPDSGPLNSSVTSRREISKGYLLSQRWPLRRIHDLEVLIQDNCSAIAANYANLTN